MNTPETAIPNQLPSPNRRRRGLVARLPLELRNLVNQCLRDGLTYDDIAFQLVPHLDRDSPEINKDHIGHWARGGYREWLQQQEMFEKSHPRNLSAQAFLGRVTPNGAAQASDLCENLIVHVITQTVQDLDPQALKNLFATNPDAFFRLTDRLAKLIAHRTRRQHAQLEAKKFDNFIDQQKRQIREEEMDEARRQGRENAFRIIAEERMKKREEAKS